MDDTRCCTAHPQPRSSHTAAFRASPSRLTAWQRMCISSVSLSPQGQYLGTSSPSTCHGSDQQAQYIGIRLTVSASFSEVLGALPPVDFRAVCLVRAIRLPWDKRTEKLRSVEPPLMRIQGQVTRVTRTGIPSLLPNGG
jgi:hypothetical protein